MPEPEDTIFMLALQAAQEFTWGFPENISKDGGRIDTLFWIMTVATVPLLLGVVAFVIYCLIRFREKEGRKAVFITGFRTFWGTTLIALFLLLLELPMDYYQERVWAEATMHPPSEEEALVVQVYPEQFAWNIRYAGKDGKFGTKDDVTYINELFVPVNKPVICVMRSRDVIHSFWLPHCRVKMDVIPGYTHRIWFETTKTGRYEIACAELCGLGHTRMRAFLLVQTPEEYKEFMDEEEEVVAEDGPNFGAEKWDLWDGKTP